MNFETRTRTCVAWVQQATSAAVVAMVFSVVALQGPAVLAWQDNPFATDAPGRPAATPTAAPTVATDSGNEVFKVTNDNARSEIGLVVRSVRSSRPETSDDLLSSIETLLDVGAVGDARFYLNQLTSKNLDSKQLFELYQLRGTEFFYQLHSADELAPAGRQFAKQVLSAAKTYSSSPQRVGQLVKSLSDENIDVRSRALNQLQRIGPAAYAEMLEVFADASRKSEFAGVRGGVQRLGDDATKVLIAAARSGHPQVQAESYVALTKLRSEAALEMVVYLFLSPSTSKSVKQLAGNRLRRVYGQINPEQLYNDIAEDARQSLKVIETSNESGGRVTDWRFDKKTKKFVLERISPALAAKRKAAIQGELLYEMRPQANFNRELFMLTRLESAKRAAGPDDVVDAEALLKKLGNPQPAELNDLLKRALQLKLVPAAIATCELIKKQAKPASLQTGRRSQLIEAILHGDRHLQFAAFDAVVAIDPQAAYPGSSHVLDLAAFLSRTQGVEKALVGHLLGSSSQSYASIVAVTGLSVSTARNGSQFYSAAIDSPDYELFVVNESLAKPSARELVQLLRRDWRTRQVPIAFLASDPSRANSLQLLAKSDPLMSVMEVSFDTRLVASKVNEVRNLSSSWPVSATSRVLHGQVAADWMFKIIDEKDTHRFYQVHKYEEAIYQLMAGGGNTEKACRAIAKLGTAKSQQSLVNFASQAGFAMQAREIAAKCFADSVKRFGTLLTTDQIRRQYDRFNASETQPAAAQKLMGLVLDAMEQRSAAE